MITITVNGAEVSAEEGTTVASAIAGCGVGVFRRSIKGEPRAPLCGMGICFECRVTIDGTAHQRSCTILAVDGMAIRTDE